MWVSPRVEVEVESPQFESHTPPSCSCGGFTLDLGPFGFVEKYRHAFQPFTSDGSGHFSFLSQPQAMNVALSVFGAALSSAIKEEVAKEKMKKGMTDSVKSAFTESYRVMRMGKLGLSEVSILLSAVPRVLSPSQKSKLTMP